MAERQRDWVWGALGLLALVVAVLVLAPPPTQLATDQRLSTLRTTPDGAEALYETLPSLGIPVARRVTPLAGVAPIRGPLALLCPVERLSPSELDSLFHWIAAGGHALISPPVLPPSYGGPLSERLGLRLAPLDPEDSLAVAKTSVWTRGLAGIRGARWGFAPDSGRAPTLESVVTDSGTGRIVVGVVHFGRGAVLAIADGGMLSNGRIRESGIAPLVARAAAEWTSAGDTMWFDEYHQGQRGGSPYRAFGAFLTRRGTGRAALQLMLVALLALLPAAVRFGAPLAGGPPPRRSRLEHVSALGDLYLEARASEVARRRLLAGFARRIGRARTSAGEEAVLLDRLEAGVVRGAEAVAAVSASWREQSELTELARRIDEAIRQLNRTQ